MRMRLLALLLLPLAGCATKPDTRLADTEPLAPVCVREYKVGSNIPTTVCSRPKTEAEREQMLEDIRNNMGPSRPPAAGGSGG